MKTLLLILLVEFLTYFLGMLLYWDGEHYIHHRDKDNAFGFGDVYIVDIFDWYRIIT